MKIKLQTKQLQNFAKLASPITSSSIIPIYDYLLITDGRIIKTNSKTFISHVIDVPKHATFLIEERSLMPLVKLTKSSEIEVELLGEKGDHALINLTDGVIEGKKLQTPPAREFDKFPSLEREDEFELTKEILEAIGFASKNIMQSGLNSNFDFVHLNKGYVFGSDTGRLFSQKIEGLPNAVFDMETANVISQFQSVIFYTRDAYNFFEIGDTLYGFKQYGDIKAPAVEQFLDKELSKEYFEFEISDILYFCDLVLSSVAHKSTEVLDCLMKGNQLSLARSEYAKDYAMTLQSTGNFVPEMYFNPKLISSFLRSLGKSSVRFHEFNKGMVFVSDPDDKGFLGMFSGLFERKVNN